MPLQVRQNDRRIGNTGRVNTEEIDKENRINGSAESSKIFCIIHQFCHSLSKLKRFMSRSSSLPPL